MIESNPKKEKGWLRKRLQNRSGQFSEWIREQQEINPDDTFFNYVSVLRVYKHIIATFFIGTRTNNVFQRLLKALLWCLFVVFSCFTLPLLIPYLLFFVPERFFRYMLEKTKDRILKTSSDRNLIRAYYVIVAIPYLIWGILFLITLVLSFPAIIFNAVVKKSPSQSKTKD